MILSIKGLAPLDKLIILDYVRLNIMRLIIELNLIRFIDTLDIILLLSPEKKLIGPIKRNRHEKHTK